MVEFHVTCHIVEALTIIYLVISQHQTKQMLIHLARTITSVNNHLDTLVSLTKEEVELEKNAILNDFNKIQTRKKTIINLNDIFYNGIN